MTGAVPGAATGIQRVRYVEGQAISAENLNAEQYARLSARWRHLVAAHDWGILYGLAVVVDDRGFAINPGVAIDGYGRELVLQTPLAFLWTGWDENGSPGEGSKALFELLFPEEDGEPSHSADLWLLWDRQPAYPPGPGRRPVGPGRHTRWLESPRLRVVPALDGLDPRQANPPEIDPACSALIPADGPWDAPPDDPAQEWPVFVGRVIQKVRTVTPGGFEYLVDPAVQRPYARLEGETVLAVSRLAQMQLSGGPGQARFSVALPDAGGALNDEKLVIEEKSGLAAYGETHLAEDTEHAHAGNLTIPNRAGITAGDLGNLAYLADTLINKPTALTEGIINTIPEEERGSILQTLQEISESGRATWAQRQAVARGLSQSLAKGLPAEVIDRVALPRVRGLPGGERDVASSLGLPIARQGMALRGKAFASSAGEEQAEPAGKSTGGEAQKLTPREVLDALNTLHPGSLGSTGEGGSAGWGVAFHPLAALPAQAAPWQMYHTVVPPAPPAPGSPPGKEVHQLRVELKHPDDKGDPRLFRFVIGYRAAVEQPFQECLAVQSDGTVIMQGLKVLVKGKLLEGPVQADPADPRFGAALVQETLRGVAAATMLTAKVTKETTPNTLRYDVTNNSSSNTFTCSSFFENITGMDQSIKRQGPVEGPFTLAPGETHSTTVKTDTLGSGQVIVTILVVGVDQYNKLAEAKFSATLTLT